MRQLHVKGYEELDVYDETGLVVNTENRTRAYIKIQEGCNRFCSYCVIPYARGKVRSRGLSEIVAEAEKLIAGGYREIVLTGINTALYEMEQIRPDEAGRLPEEPYGVEKVIAALSDIPGDFRIRLSSLEPAVVDADYVKRLLKYDKLCHHLHLSAQSGSSQVLAAMNRRYTRDHYRALVAKLRDAVPDIALSTDIIVGFPGETAKDFEDTYRLVDEVGYHQVFTFIYSKREGTPAASMDDDTPREVIQQRFDRLVDLVQQRAFEANQRDLGSTVDVLVEGASKRDERLLAGKSPKNQTVHAPAPAGVRAEDLAGSTVRVRVDEAKTWYLAGEVAEGSEPPAEAADGR